MQRPGKDTPRAATAVLGLVALAAGLRLFGARGAPLSAAEVDAVASAFDFVERGHLGTGTWHHAPDLLVWASVQAFGAGPLAFRGATIALGALCVALVALLARRVSGSSRVALAAALFAATDAVWIDSSRRAPGDLSAFFVLAGVLAALAAEGHGRHVGLIAVAGVLFGIGGSTTWAAVFPAAVTLAWLCWRTLSDPTLDRLARVRELLLLLAALVVVPLAVYVVAWSPWFLHRGFDLADWVSVLRAAGAEPGAARPSDSPAALWFVKPFARAALAGAREGPHASIAVSNPLVWMATLPAATWAAARAWRLREGGAVLVAALFWGAYLPIVLAGRTVRADASFAVTPFAFVLVAWAADAACRRVERPRLLGLYLAAVLAVATPLYLLASGGGVAR